jgi:tRNA (guanosine-2'-O-)-methyltransferase
MIQGITEDRLNRIRDVVRNRQHDLTVILENVHDPHNIGAVLRTCDSVGISEIYVVYTEKELQERGLFVGSKSSTGVRQWLHVNYYTSLAECFGEVRKKYNQVLGAVVANDSMPIYSFDLTPPIALLFGNEHGGLSDEAISMTDGRFVVPQVGFVKSLNISVACAVTLYEVFRQRLENGAYGREFGNQDQDGQLFENYCNIHLNKKNSGSKKS